jgi:hypothetical protein
MAVSKSVHVFFCTCVQSISYLPSNVTALFSAALLNACTPIAPVRASTQRPFNLSDQY